MVAFTAEATPTVVTAKVADVWPDATATVPGTVALDALEVSVTVSPPDGAGPFSVTVPVELTPPITEVGDKDRADTPNGFTVSAALCVPVP